nr:alpha-xenorhabdolysin family binary toxin subunit A [uncultured Desulfobacter sp.]
MTLFVPSSQLLVAAGDRQNAQKFVLASREWIDLQNHVQAVLSLPYDFGEYQDRYGDASSGSQMKECFDAMHQLQQVIEKYGDPKSLRGKILKNPNYLAEFNRPLKDTYSATVWTLEKAHQNASSLASALKSIPTSAKGESPSDVVAGIKHLFLDTDQIVDKMQQTTTQLEALVREFQDLQDELDQAQQAMAAFTKRSSATRKYLDEEIGSLRDKIAQLEKDRDAAYDKWLALTISACVAPAIIGIVGIAIMVVLAVPTEGGSFAIGGTITAAAAGAAGAALGTAAGVARGSYDSLVQEVNDKQAFLQKRVAYRHDLGALNNLMKFSLPASTGLIGQINIVKNAWAGSIQEIRSRVSDLSVENLGTGPWLDEQKMAAAAANWTRVDDALKSFVIGSFVDSTSITFGNALPADDPNWKEKMVAQVAA